MRLCLKQQTISGQPWLLFPIVLKGLIHAENSAAAQFACSCSGQSQVINSISAGSGDPVFAGAQLNVCHLFIIYQSQRYIPLFLP